MTRGAATDRQRGEENPAPAFGQNRADAHRPGSTRHHLRARRQRRARALPAPSATSTCADASRRDLGALPLARDGRARRPALLRRDDALPPTSTARRQPELHRKRRGSCRASGASCSTLLPPASRPRRRGNGAAVAAATGLSTSPRTVYAGADRASFLPPDVGCQTTPDGRARSRLRRRGSTARRRPSPSCAATSPHRQERRRDPDHAPQVSARALRRHRAEVSALCRGRRAGLVEEPAMTGVERPANHSSRPSPASFHPATTTNAASAIRTPLRTSVRAPIGCRDATPKQLHAGVRPRDDEDHRIAGREHVGGRALHDRPALAVAQLDDDLDAVLRGRAAFHRVARDAADDRADHCAVAAADVRAGDAAGDRAAPAPRPPGCHRS